MRNTTIRGTAEQIAIHAADLIQKNGGKPFEAQFVKKDGSIRDIKARTGIGIGVKGVGHKFNPTARHLQQVWDDDKQEHRFINLRTLRTLRTEDAEIKFELAE